MNTGFWTDDRVKHLAKLVDEGLSAGQIGARLGCTRNAVIGKIIRMRGKVGRLKGAAPLAGRRRAAPSRALLSPIRAYPPAETAPAPAGRNAPVRQHVNAGNIASKKEARAFDPGFIEPGAPAEAPSARMLALTSLTEKTCRWPVGDPKSEGFGFCGHVAAGSGPYCPFHAALSVSERKLKPIRAPYERGIVKVG